MHVCVCVCVWNCAVGNFKKQHKLKRMMYRRHITGVLKISYNTTCIEAVIRNM